MRARAAVVVTLLAVTAARADEHGAAVFVPSPSRPFLLLDARRRYRPQDHAHAYIQRRGGGAVSLSLFRVRDARAFVDASVSLQGVSTAAGPWGDEAESLLRAHSPLPRRGSRLSLVMLRHVPTVLQAAPRRAVGDESAAYDSNEDDEGMVETWGVSARGWGVADADLGPLPAGTYLLRAQDGMFATSALLSVGETVVLLRRGDARDLARVSDSEGRALADVEVEAVAGSEVVRARTNAQGEATLPPSDAPARRVYATRGDELAWADATHARLPACDARVYLATGRPSYRPGEPVRVRGHVRACAPLAGARVRVYAGREHEPGETVTADADGNFSATLPAASELHAEHEGRVHSRTIHLDSRPVPSGSLRLGVDRPWAAAGERVTVTATPSSGAGLRTVAFSWPGGHESQPVADGAAASVSFVMPTTSSALERFTVRATGVGSSETVAAQVSLWTGRLREVLSLDAGDARGVENAELSLALQARDLGGAPAPGPVQLGVFGSDGNRPRGEARWSGEASVPPSGGAAARVRLVGSGPWWVRARRGEALAETVVWERPRPASLSGSGPLALLPDREYVAPGESLGVSLRAAGPVWVTLEQGGVWSSTFATPGRDGTGSLRFDPPAGARGLATLVATRVHLGRVETASAVTEVASSQRFSLAVETDRRTYPAGAAARVIVRARTTSGAPRSAVLSMWLEDAGWWSLGEDRQPSVDAYFRATGRPASGGDSTSPLGFGSEEGRRSDSGMFWNGERVPGTTYRHAWGHGSAVVNFRARGDLARVASELARAAGLNGASMCAARVRPAGTVDLEVRELPWDLVAARLAERTRTWVRRDAGGLRFACTQPAGGDLGLAGHGAGSGSGSGYGSGSARTRDREQLTGTQWFLPARRIDATGELRLEVPLPAAPGRWRLHALAIADDGAGATADADLDTTQQVAATLHAPRALAAGDVIEAEVRVRRNDGGSDPLTLRLGAEGGVEVEGAGELPLTFDAQGVAQRVVRVRGVRPGDGAITATTLRAGGAIDALRAAITVRDDHAEQPVDYRAVLTAEPTDVDLPIPPLAEPASLRVELDGSLVGAAVESLATLRAPRWHLGALQLDRYASLRALESLATGLRSAEGRTLARAVRMELAGAGAQLRALCGSDGEIAWWSQMQGSHALTAAALALGVDDARTWTDAWTSLRAEAPRAHGPLAARLAAALSRGTPADRALVGPLVDRVEGSDLEDLAWSLRAARAVADAPRARRLAARLREAVDRTVSNDHPAACAGPAWFLCLSRDGTRGALAFAARALLEAQPDARPSAVRAARWLSTRPEEGRRWSWGTAEADILALLAALSPNDRAGGRFTASLGDARLGEGDARAGLTVTVRDPGTLRLSFAAAAGRFTRVRVRGSMRVAPPSQPVGSVRLVRTFEGEGSERVMVLAFTLPRDATGVELHAPIPAGLEFALGAESPVAQRDPFQGWRELDGPAGDARARVTRLDDGVRVRFASLRAGAHSVRVPLVAVARGEFRAGSAWLRADGSDLWAVTPAWRAALR